MSKAYVEFPSLCVMSYAHGMTQWAYRCPTGHLSSDLALPSYWESASNVVKPGDWLFAVHTAPQGTYNAIYAFTLGPMGIWAQQLLATVPPIGR